MTKLHSAGIILHRCKSDGLLEVFVVHPGGPFWQKKDDGAWSIPKGLVEDDDTDLIAVARREFLEEVGIPLNSTLEFLGDFKQPSGKIIHVWTANEDIGEVSIHSNTFDMEWPPKSGVIRQFPEVDRAGWFRIGLAREKLLKGQLPILDALVAHMSYDESQEKPSDAKGQFNLL